MDRRKLLASIGVVGMGSLSGCIFGGDEESTDDPDQNNGGNNDESDQLDESVEEDPEERDYQKIWTDAVSNFDNHTSGRIELSTTWETGQLVTTEPEYPEYTEDGRLIELTNTQTRVVEYDRDSRQFYVDEETTFGRFETDPPDFTEQSYERELFYEPDSEILYGLIQLPEDLGGSQWISEPRGFDSIESNLISLPEFPSQLPENTQINSDLNAAVEYTFTLSDSELLLNSLDSEGYYLSGIQQSANVESTVVVQVDLSSLQIRSLSVEFNGRTEDQFNNSNIELSFEYDVPVQYSLPRPASEAGDGDFYHPQR